MPTVLIGPAPLRNKPGSFRDILVKAGFTVVDIEGDNTLTAAQMRPVLPQADAMIAGGELLSAEMLALAPKLRVIARTGVGYDAIDLAAANARKIVVAITPGTNHDSVAEMTFSLILSLARNIVNNDRVIRAGGWDRTMVQEVRGKTLGIVGLGRIGRAVALRGKAFGMTLLAFDPLADAAFAQAHGITLLSLEALLSQSQYVTLHTPLIDSTRGMINKRTLALMPQGSYLINTARGGLVVEADLAESLAGGHLAGAGLDVLNQEPPERDNPLLPMPQVIFSPHMGGLDVKSMADMATKAAECVADLYQGRWPAECVVNPEVGPDWKW